MQMDTYSNHDAFEAATGTYVPRATRTPQKIVGAEQEMSDWGHFFEVWGPSSTLTTGTSCEAAGLWDSSMTPQNVPRMKPPEASSPSSASTTKTLETVEW